MDEFETFIEGDSFLNEDEQEAESAKERRLKRKRRLEEAASKEQQNDEAKHDDASKLKSTQSLPVIPPRNDESELKQQSTNAGKDVKEDDTEDEFDMFSSSTSPPLARDMLITRKHQDATKDSGIDQQQDFDDAEGYYKATIGESISFEISNSSSLVKFKVSGVVGKGVFSTVLKCVTESSDTSIHLPPQVALKFIRHNATMAHAAMKEIKFLQRISSCPGIIPLLLPTSNVPLEYRGHTILVFPHMEYNLRDILKKYGQGLGISLTAVRSYFGQLLAALNHLRQHNIIHSDLKPDNILVSQDFSAAVLCDFGSAIGGDESVEMITPYLVSRFYRAPEVILGLMPSYAIDLWSLAVTMAELFLGKVLLKGMNNNDMLNEMMLHMGPMSNRLIRQHLVQTKKFPLPVHFMQDSANFIFKRETVDPVSGQPVHKATLLQSFTQPSLQSKLLKAKSAKDDRTLVIRFSDLLKKCLVLDPTRRITVKEARGHDFFKD